MILELLGIPASRSRETSTIWYQKYCGYLVGLDLQMVELASIIEHDNEIRIFIQGPSGSGKTALVNNVLESAGIVPHILNQEARHRQFIDRLAVNQTDIWVVEDYDMANDVLFNDFLTQVSRVIILGCKKPRTLKNFKLIDIPKPRHKDFVQVLRRIESLEKVEISDSLLADIISTSNYDFRYAITLLQTGIPTKTALKDDKLTQEEKLHILPLLTTTDVFRMTDKFFNILMHENYLKAVPRGSEVSDNLDHCRTLAEIADTLSTTDLMDNRGLSGEYEGIVPATFQVAGLSFQCETTSFTSTSNFSNKASIIHRQHKKTRRNKNGWLLGNIMHKYIVAKDWNQLAQLIKSVFEENDVIHWFEIYKTGVIRNRQTLSTATRNRVSKLVSEIV